MQAEFNGLNTRPNATLSTQLALHIGEKIYQT